MLETNEPLNHGMTTTSNDSYAQQEPAPVNLHKAFVLRHLHNAERCCMVPLKIKRFFATYVYYVVQAHSYPEQMH